MNSRDILNELLSNSDEKYKNFHSVLIPGIEKDKIIGVRVPKLRLIAREVFLSGEWKEFINRVPHKYYEEDNLHCLIISQIKDLDESMYETEKFLPYINNWATCDMFRPNAFKNNKKELLEKIKLWIKSDKVYTVRFAVGMLMSHFLKEDYKKEYIGMVACIKREEYYINMMCAWYFATALSYRYDDTITFFEERKINTYVNNKAIQKAIESRRISDEKKDYLRTLKICL